MAAGAVHTLPKKERLSGRTDISRLLDKGRYGIASCLKYCYLTGTGLPYGRILVSVPKRHFKRAVKRNLLKRRIRESYRRQKALLGPGVDILFVYTPKEVLPYDTIYADMTALLSSLSSARV